MSTIIDKAKSWAQSLAGARSAVSQLHETEARLLDNLSQLRAKRDQLLSSRPPRADVIANMEAAVAQLGATWLENHGEYIVGNLAGGLDVGVRGDVAGIRAGRLKSESFHPFDAFPSGNVSIDALCALAPTLVRESLKRIIDSARYEAGPPLTERAPRIAIIDAEIEELEREHAALVDQAEAAGIKIDHTAEERGRRARESARRSQIDGFNAVNRRAIENGHVQAMTD